MGLFFRYVGFFFRVFKWLEATLQSIYTEIQGSCGYIYRNTGFFWLYIQKYRVLMVIYTEIQGSYGYIYRNTGFLWLYIQKYRVLMVIYTEIDRFLGPKWLIGCSPSA